MAKNVILMIGDGMGWEMSRASAIGLSIEAEIEQIRTDNPGITNEEIAARFQGRTLDDYYTQGKGSGTSYQDLSGYTIATTGNTYIDGSKSNSALQSNPKFQPNVFNHNTGQAKAKKDFEFDSSPAEVVGFDPQLNSTSNLNGGFNEAPVIDANNNIVGGNIPIFDLEKGGITPWDDNYYQNRDSTTIGFNQNYIKNLYPDSAGTATGLYSGVKTYVGAVSVDVYEEAVQTAAEAAQEAGKSIGVVSSVPFNHATPGSAIAHVNHRYKYNPHSFDQKVGNDDGKISNEVDEFGHKIEPRDNIFYQMVNETKPTVVLGGGHYLTNGGTEAQPDETYITKAEVQKLRQGKYDYIFIERGENASQVLADTAAKLDPEAGDRLFGLYGAKNQGGNLPWRTANDDYSRTGHNLNINRANGALSIRQPTLESGESLPSFIQQEIDANPTLPELTQAALEVLGKDNNGFWLMVEGGDIDWAAHGNDMDNLLGTMKDFDESIAAVRTWIEKNGGDRENLLIVTADHDHYLTLNNNFPEVLANSLITGEGGIELTLNPNPVATAHFWGSDATVKNGWATHTTRPVPVYFQGADADIISEFQGFGYEAYGKEVVGVSNFIDQTHLGIAQIEALGGTVNPNPDVSLSVSWHFVLTLVLIISFVAMIVSRLKLRNRYFKNR